MVGSPPAPPEVAPLPPVDPLLETLPFPLRCLQDGDKAGTDKAGTGRRGVGRVGMRKGKAVGE